MAPAQLSTTASRSVRILPTLVLAAAAAFTGLPAAQAQSTDGPPARGFIVKLRDKSGTTTQTTQAARERLASVASRRHVSFLDSRPSALGGAHVLNYGRWLKASEARAEAARLRADPEVEWVTINSLERRMGVAPTYPATIGDPDAGSQQWWLMQNGSNYLSAPNVPGAWTVLSGRTLTPVVVAVLDSGVRGDHPDLAGQLLPGYDFVSEYDFANDGNSQDPDPTDPGDWVSSQDRAYPNIFDSDCEVTNSSWHGTHIAGQLAAGTNNGIGVAGMLWQLQAAAGSPVVLPVRVAGKCGAVVSDIIEGMYWAAGIAYTNSPALNPHPARVISISYGGTEACNTSASGAYVTAIAKLREAGVLVVAAAGNGAGTAPGDATSSRPANCTGVLGVTAVNSDGTKAFYANLYTGSQGIATVGGDAYTALGSTGTYAGIYSTSNSGLQGPAAYDGNGYYDAKAGTSFSTPIAAGVATMMLSISPTLTPEQIITAIQNTSVAWTTVSTAQAACGSGSTGYCKCTLSTCGGGILNAQAAVNYAVTNTGSDTALNARLTSSGAITPGAVTSTYTPTRGSATSRKNSGGGGGAVQPAWLAGLALAVFVLAASRRATRR